MRNKCLYIEQMQVKPSSLSSVSELEYIYILYQKCIFRKHSYHKHLVERKPILTRYQVERGDLTLNSEVNFTRKSYNIPLVAAANIDLFSAFSQISIQLFIKLIFFSWPHIRDI